MSLDLLMNLVEVAIKIPTLMSKLRVREHARVSKGDCSDSFPPCVHMQHAAQMEFVSPPLKTRGFVTCLDR